MSIRCFFAIWYLNAIIFSLLGFAAFAGLIAVLVGWALHSYITRIGIQIQKELSTSRDNRMSVLDELVKAVKYIKFFAWEDSWIERVLDTRNVEMGLMKKSQCPLFCNGPPVSTERMLNQLVSIPSFPRLFGYLRPYWSL